MAKTKRKSESAVDVGSTRLLGRCATCSLWQPAPTTVPGCAPKKICGGSRNMAFGMYGQDGRSVITTGDFGCVHHRPNTKLSAAAEPRGGEHPPPPKEGWNHSEQVMVFYPASDHESGLSDGYGIAYFHHDPPHAGPKWVDFANYGRKPLCWWPLPLPPNAPADLPPTEARQPRSGTEGAIGG